MANVDGPGEYSDIGQSPKLVDKIKTIFRNKLYNDNFPCWKYFRAEQSLLEGAGRRQGGDLAGFVEDLRAACVQKKSSAIDARKVRHDGYKLSIKDRKLVEEIFGWSKTAAGLRA